MDHFAGLDVSVKETKVCQWQILALKTSEGWQRMSAIEGGKADIAGTTRNGP